MKYPLLPETNLILDDVYGLGFSNLESAVHKIIDVLRVRE